MTDSRIVNYSFGKEKPIDLAEELDNTINADSDFNSKMSLAESYKTDKSNEYRSTQETILQHVKIAFPNDAQVQNAIQNSFGVDSTSNSIDKDLELMILQSRAAQKLLASNGNENVLTPEEKEALGVELATIKNSFARKKELQEVKDEVVAKVETTQFMDVRG